MKRQWKAEPAQDHKRNEPYTSPVPLPVSGKAILSSDHQQSSVLVWWFGGLYSDSEVRKVVVPYIRNCYPEATNIKLWQEPDKVDCLRATFDIVVEKAPVRKSKISKNPNLDWKWRYETPSP